jgi:hypothetical protein
VADSAARRLTCHAQRVITWAQEAELVLCCAGVCPRRTRVGAAVCARPRHGRAQLEIRVARRLACAARLQAVVAPVLVLGARQAGRARRATSVPAARGALGSAAAAYIAVLGGRIAAHRLACPALACQLVRCAVLGVCRLPQEGGCRHQRCRQPPGRRRTRYPPLWRHELSSCGVPYRVIVLFLRRDDAGERAETGHGTMVVGAATAGLSAVRLPSRLTLWPRKYVQGPPS